jgi:hypothetical protein
MDIGMITAWQNFWRVFVSVMLRIWQVFLLCIPQFVDLSFLFLGSRCYRGSNEVTRIPKGEAEARAVAAFNFIFTNGPKIEFDHHLVYYARKHCPLN